MAEGQVDWRSETFRRKVITQIDEAVRSSNTTVTKSSVEMENHVFHKAKTREEYLALVARLILHVKDFNSQKREKAQQQMAPQMAAASGMGQMGGMQDPINALQNMAMSGAGMPPGQPAGMMGSSQPMGPIQQMTHGPQIGTRQPGVLQQQLHQQRAGMPQRPPLQRQDAFIVTAAQTVQQPGTSQQVTAPVSGTIVLTSTSTAPQPGSLLKQSQFVTSLLGQASPQVSTSSQGLGTAPSPAQAGSLQPAGSPLSMMSPHSNIEPSPMSHSALSVGAPSPSAALNTPGNPGSEPSPAPQSADEQAYLEKLKQLSKYIDPLRRMIKKTEKDGKDADRRRIDISKMKNLLDTLNNPAKRVSMSILLKCEQVLEKIQFSTTNASLSSAQPTTAASTLPTQPTIPAGSHVHMCQPLLDSVAAHITSPIFNHTLKRTFGPAVTALYGSPIRAPSPPLKKPRLEEEGRIPDLLQGEIARLDRRFKVKLDPMRHTGQKEVHLVCKLDDKYLPSVPPILVTVPEDYPDNSPECSTCGKEYDATPFLRAAQKALVTHLQELPSIFSLTALLDMWEISVRKACVSAS